MVTTRAEAHPERLPWFAGGRLDRAASEEIERHLTGCEDCRAEVNALRSMYRSLRASTPEHHVAVERLVDFRAGRLPRAERRLVAAHVHACPACASDVAALVSAGGGRRAGRRAVLALAAASVLVFVVGAWRLSTGPAVEPASHVVIEFGAPVRGAESRPSLGPGPWEFRVWAPSRTRASVYVLRVDRVEEGSRQTVLEVTTVSDRDGRIELTVSTALRPGAHELLLLPQEGSAPISVHGFDVGAAR